MKQLAYLSFIIIFLLQGCVTYIPPTASRNIASVYNPNGTAIHPEFSVFHGKDTISQLRTRIATQELQYNRANATGANIAKIRINYQLFASYESYHIIDSASVVYEIPKGSTNDDILSKISFVFPSHLENAVLKISVTDLLGQVYYAEYLNLKRSNKNDAQQFFVSDFEKKIPHFRTFFMLDEKIQIEHNSGVTEVYVDYYSKNFPTATPPFSSSRRDTVPTTADSSWTMKMGLGTYTQLTKNGMYRFRVDTSEQNGLTLHNFGKSFPTMQSPENLINPLQYLTSSKEFKVLLVSGSKKIATDEFWLTASRNISRAKELIKIFYDRILFANLYFKSYKEGWKTDRGMIYVIHGTPSQVYRTSYDEKWLYGRGMKTITFVFNKKANIFSDKNYVLDRMSAYMKSWYKAVEYWRNGRPYFLNN